MSEPVKKTKVNDITQVNFSVLKWVVTFGVPIIIGFMPTPASMTPEIKLFFAITLWAILSWVFEILPNALVGIVLPVLYVLFKLGTPKEAFSGWTTTIPWIIVGGMIIGMILITSGLAKRIAYWTILKSGASFRGILIGIMLAGIILAPFVPSIMGKMSIFVPIAIGICQALELEPKSRGASAVMLAAFVAVSSPCFSYLTGGAHIIMPMGLVAKVTGQSISWSEYAAHNFIINILWSFISILIIIFALKPEKIINGKSVVKEKYVELGPVTVEQRKVGLILIIALIALATDSIHKINPAWVFVLLGAITFIPQVGLMNGEKLNKLNFPIIFFVVGSMAIGSVAVKTGASKWVAGLLFPYLTGSPLYTIVATWFFGVIMNFILTPLAAAAAFTVPVAQMAVDAGLNPWPVVYSLLQGLDQYIFPYEFAVLLFVYSFGYTSLRDLIKVMALKMFLSLIFVMTISYTYWKFMGLFN